ncbi:hypothetical protein [Actinophytocola sp.]|uniref:hypothetical protein n=1 Tax=Actinophytocola sp. TaxID=1872138 RepID=UPI003D6AD1E3
MAELHGPDLMGDITLPAAVEKTNGWAVALSRALGSGKSAPRIRGVIRTAIGFVTTESGARLAMIFYVRPLALPQAAPMSVEVDGTEFPVVLRRLPKTTDSYGALPFRNGILTSRARVDGRWGVLTAAHVAADDGDEFSLKRGDRVTCCFASAERPVTRTVLDADPIMDAALVEDEPPSPAPRTVKAYPFCGFVPVRIHPDHGLGRPYGMFVGANGYKTGPRGRVHMFRQLEIVWGLELAGEQKRSLL